MSKIDDIILAGQKEGKTYEEITADLKAAGFPNTLGEKIVNGNAQLYQGGDTYETVLVEDGKLVAAGCGPTDYVLYDGKPWHTENGDNYTLIPGYPACYGNPKPEWLPEEDPAWAVPWEQELDKYKPEKGMMFRPEYAGRKVQKGKLLYRYDAEGNAEYEPISMKDYDEDHGRNQ